MKTIYQKPLILVRCVTLASFITTSDPETTIDPTDSGIDPGDFEAKDQLKPHDVWED